MGVIRVSCPGHVPSMVLVVLALLSPAAAPATLGAAAAFESPLACTAPPGEVRDLMLSADGVTLSWSAPLDSGGEPPVYDTLHTYLPWDFAAAADCVEWNDGADTQALDPLVPPAGFILFYLVRAENTCGPGTLGTASDGLPRPPGRSCGPCVHDVDCDDGQFCNGAEVCVGGSACDPGVPPDCAPYACDPAANGCFTTCTTDADCAPGHGCQDGICWKLEGQPCDVDSECLSGFCADGVCCESSCAGTCESCGLPGREGFCDPVPAGADPGGDCASEPVSTCGTTGVCDGARACELHPAGTLCSPASCSPSLDVAFLPDQCDGAGTCVDGGEQSCSPYACSASTGACRTSCTSDTDCLSGYGCAGGQCLLQDGQPCVAGGECVHDACCGNVCVDPATDPNNCGVCDLVCTNPHGSTACTGGACSPACDTDWDDCNGDPVDGCETSLRTLTDCGACAVPCDFPNASESCSTGTCAFTACNASYSNCDGSTANGCEVYHKSYPNSCGTSENVGSYCADESDGFLCPGTSCSTRVTRTGRTSKWFRARANECSDCCADVETQIILTPPSGTDYDLFAYSACGTLITSSQQGGSQVESIVLYKEDGCFGDDTSFDFWIEVRHWSGQSCSNWTLAFRGGNCR